MMMAAQAQLVVILSLLTVSQFGNSFVLQQTSHWSRRDLGLHDAKSSTTTTTTTTTTDEDEDHQEQHVSLEYCTGCRWMLRSAWMAQELLTTFQDELDSLTLVPSRESPGGVFIVRQNKCVVWDRKVEGGFPESKELKQRIRNLVAPEKFLGHSDTPEERARNDDYTVREDCVECDDHQREVAVSSRYDADNDVENEGTPAFDAPKPNVAIVYCSGCRWLLRAAWIAQELLTTFETEIASVSLIPSRPPAKGGIFIVSLDGHVLWDRTEQGRFPQPKELKQRIRDKVAPSNELGHSDVSSSGDTNKADANSGGIDAMDDDEAAELRRHFGVM